MRTVWLDGKTFDLTSGEYDILWHLASHAGQISSRDALYYHIRGTEYDGVDRSIDQHISNIRKKIGDDPRTPAIIKNAYAQYSGTWNKMEFYLDFAPIKSISSYKSIVIFVKNNTRIVFLNINLSFVHRHFLLSIYDL